MTIVYLNNQFVDEAEAKISVFDRSYLYGTGVFETLRAYGGRPAWVFRHYQRLERSADALHLPLPFNHEQWSQVLAELLARNQLLESTIRATVSDNTSIYCRPVNIDPKCYTQGVKILLCDNLRNNDAATAGIKSTSYLVKMLARQRAAEAGAYEAILKNQQDHWVEGSKTNLFVVQQGTVLTAPLPEGLLPGVTRDVVLEILRDNKIPCRETPITDNDLLKADEIFLTGSTTEVTPVAHLTGTLDHPVPLGQLAKKLRDAYLKIAK